MSKTNAKPLRWQHSEAIAKPWVPARRLGFAEASSQDKRLAQIDRFGHSVVLGPLHCIVIEKVKPQGVFACVAFREEPVPQLHPFLLSHLALKDRLLHAGPVIRARPRHPSQPASARLLDSRNIISDQDHHGSLRNQRQIFLQIAAEVASKNAGLDKWHLPDAQILIEQRVLHSFLLPFLIGGDDQPASGIGELDGATLALPEMLGTDLAPIDQRNRQPVGDLGAELLHQIEGQRRPIRAFRMKEADEWVETDCGKRGDAIVPHEGVEETEKAVDPVARRAS